MFNLAQSNTFILFQKSKKKLHYIKPNCSIHKYNVIKKPYLNSKTRNNIRTNSTSILLKIPENSHPYFKSNRNLTLF